MVGSPMAASSIHQRGRSKRFSHSLKVRNSRSLHFRFSLYRRSIRNAQCFEGSIGSRALAHKRPPDGDHRAGSSLEVHGLCRMTPRPMLHQPRERSGFKIVWKDCGSLSIQVADDPATCTFWCAVPRSRMELYSRLWIIAAAEAWCFRKTNGEQDVDYRLDCSWPCRWFYRE
jgi:hypothetical protein